MKIVRRLSRPTPTTRTTATTMASLLSALSKAEALANGSPSAAARRLVADGFRHLLDLTGSQFADLARALPPAGLTQLIEALASELRRINALQADGQDPLNGPRAKHDRTFGESGHIAKVLQAGGAESNTDVLAAAKAIETLLEAVIREHEQRLRQDPYRDGDIIGKSRSGQHMSLDELDRYATQQLRFRAQHANQPADVVGALGLSKLSRETAEQIEKGAAQSLPADSYAGQDSLWWQRIRRP